ncbi:MAG: KTSC domain-containing protein [Clostridium sp.]|nr:KTSC domain-containing protein [Clostridium sp.]
MEISFYPRCQLGMEIYFSPDSDKFSIIKLDDKYYIRIKNPEREWIYPTWKENKFRTFDEAQSWLSLHDWESADHDHIKYDDSVFINMAFTALSDRQSVLAAINTKNLANDLVRVRSSNVWAYGLNIKNRKDKTGDLLVQFKNKNGGAGDVYIYYDVPVMIYRRWQSAPSKGHYFWVYIRNNFNYSKLTGDKRGKLGNAVN